MAYTDSYGVVFSDDRRTLVKCPSTFTGTYNIPDGTLTVSREAFKDCIKLSALTLPVSLELIDVNAFSNCKTLNDIYYKGTVFQWLNILQCKAYAAVGYNLWFLDGTTYKKLTKLEVPDGIPEIRDLAFYYCRSLTVVKFGKGLKKIGDSAFNKVSIGFPWPWIKIPDGVTHIGQYAFLACGGLETVEIPESVTFIGKGCFSYCSKLHRIEISKENSLYSSGEDDDAIYDKFQTKLIQCICSSEYDITIAKTCREIEDFAFVGCGGFKVYLPDIQKPATNVKDCKCQFKVAFGQKARFVSLGFPANQVSELYDKKSILKPGETSLRHIYDNPFRVLGVPSTASTREISSNATKIKRFSQAGKSLEFELDSNQYLPAVDRSPERVEAALASVNLPKDKLQNALFWFACVNDSDKESIALFKKGDAAEIRNFFFEQDKYKVSPQNSALMLYMSNKLNLETFIANSLYAIRQKDYVEQWVHAVCGENFTITEEELNELLINSLLEDCDSKQLYLLLSDSYKKEEAAEFVKAKIIGSYQVDINAEIQNARSVPRNDAVANLQAGETLIRKTKDAFSAVKSFLPETDPQYVIIADALAKQILQSGINYYNSSQDSERAFKSLEIMSYAESIAASDFEKKHCKDSTATMRKIVHSLPPKGCQPIHDEIESLIESTKPTTIEQVIAFLKNGATLIVKVKTMKESNARTGNDILHYRDYIQNISTEIGAHALDESIEIVNNYIKGHTGEAVIKFVNKAWENMCYIGSLDLQKEYREKRFNPNNKTLGELVDQARKAEFHGFAFGSRPQYSLDLRTERELYNDCAKNEKSCDTYITNYPQGKYLTEVQSYKEGFEWARCKTITDYRNYVAKYPRGKYSSEANSKILVYDTISNEIESMTTLSQLAAAHEQHKGTIFDEAIDHRYYSLCRNKADCRQYMDLFKNGKHYSDASKRANKDHKSLCVVLGVLTTGLLAGAIAYWISGDSDLFWLWLAYGTFGNCIIPVFILPAYLFTLIIDGPPEPNKKKK